MEKKGTKKVSPVTFRVLEIFSSVNGEGTRSGQLALFLRMQGCNLNCSYCDTAWANRGDAAYRLMSAEEILEAVRSSGLRNVTLTGGEPLLEKEAATLLLALTEDPRLRVEIETNGSIALAPLLAELAGKISGEEQKRAKEGQLLPVVQTGQISFGERRKRLCFNMDYKLPGSGMEGAMCAENFSSLCAWDTVKFVVSDRTDLDRARELVETYELTEKCRVYLSPVFGAIDPKEIVAYMKEFLLNDVSLQLQLHKVIWGPKTRGV